MLRIGEVASEVGTTPRTIRYYEEIGLLPAAADRPSGGHRNYTTADVERLRELIRLRDLLGVSLEELRELVEAEEARAVLEPLTRVGRAVADWARFQFALIYAKSGGAYQRPRRIVAHLLFRRSRCGRRASLSMCEAPA